jgi:hypothetical protein
LGIEIQTLYYAYEAEQDSALKYTTFVDQCIINRSASSYHDVYIGHFIDFDLGYFYDDFLHCDTNLGPGDRRRVISSGPYILEPGTNRHANVS